MFYAYVLQSIAHPEYLYKGHTQDMHKRLKEHNGLKTQSNKRFAPFAIIYYEAFPTREEAISRENYWKTAAGRRYLHRVINSGLVVQRIE